MKHFFEILFILLISLNYSASAEELGNSKLYKKLYNEAVVQLSLDKLGYQIADKSEKEIQCRLILASGWSGIESIEIMQLKGKKNIIMEHRHFQYGETTVTRKSFPNFKISEENLNNFFKSSEYRSPIGKGGGYVSDAGWMSLKINVGGRNNLIIRPGSDDPYIEKSIENIIDYMILFSENRNPSEPVPEK